MSPVTAAALSLAAPQLLDLARELVGEDTSVAEEECLCDPGPDASVCILCRARVAIAIAEGRLVPDAPPPPEGEDSPCCDHEGPHGRCDYLVACAHEGDHARVEADGTIHVWADDDSDEGGYVSAEADCRCGGRPPEVAP